MQTALVHYWLVQRRGGEHVLDAMAELLPSADLISHVVDPNLLSGPLAGCTVRRTFISKLPLASTRYPLYLPLMPLALEMMDMSRYGLIVSSEAGPAKWVVPNPDTYHLCYCHSPLRYIWDQKNAYLSRFPGPLRLAAEAYASHLRGADIRSANGVDAFVANSSFVARRIWKFYRREAEVVHPPVNVDKFSVSEPEDFYLLAGAIRGYKGADISVRACAELGRPLVVVGSGNTAQLQRLAGPKAKFLGRVDDATFHNLLSRCRALLFPGVEDFGIVPVEAMASGRPVIAYGKGGALDSIVHGESGILYNDPSVEGLKRAILQFESEEASFKPAACLAQATKFRPEVFKIRFAQQIPRGVSKIADHWASQAI